MLADAVPEMSEALERRRHDATQLDPAGNLRWPLVEGLVQPDNDARLAAEYKRLDHPERVLLAALALDATDQGVDASLIAMGLCARLGMNPDGDAAISDLVSKPELLRAAAARPTQLGQNHVLQLASHLGSEESTRASYVLGVVLGPMEQWERDALDELLDRLLPLVSGDVVEQRRQVARRLCQTRDAQERVDHAPRAYILAVDATSVARQAQLVDPLPRRGDVRLKIRAVDDVTSVVEVAGRDQKGFLAAITRALAVENLDVVDATIATWGDGGVVDSFIVRHGASPSADRVQAAVEQALRRPSKVSTLVGNVLQFDDEASPWHTRCSIEAPDRPGLLADLTASFASVGVSVHSARIRTDNVYGFDEFALSSRDGSKLTDADRAALGKALGADIPDAQSAHAMETK